MTRYFKNKYIRMGKNQYLYRMTTDDIEGDSAKRKVEFYIFKPDTKPAPYWKESIKFAHRDLTHIIRFKEISEGDAMVLIM